MAGVKTDETAMVASQKAPLDGLRETYHSVHLNYSLVNADRAGKDVTLDSVWTDGSKSFLASYDSEAKVYALDSNPDCFVAFLDTSEMNDVGDVVDWSFTDMDSFNPTILNDQVTFDPDTGIAYIPKSLYFNEDGDEIVYHLQAQLLALYDVDNAKSTARMTIR